MTTPSIPATRTELRQRLLAGLLFQLDHGVPEAGAHLLGLLREWPDTGPPGEALADPLSSEHAPAYEDIGPWDSSHGHAFRIDLRPDGLHWMAYTRNTDLPCVWNTGSGEWECALSRETADARLRELYPPRAAGGEDATRADPDTFPSHETADARLRELYPPLAPEAPRSPPRGHPSLGVGPTCPYCSAPDALRKMHYWLCRACNKCWPADGGQLRFSVSGPTETAEEQAAATSAGPACPTCGLPTHRKLSGVWLCRTCRTAKNEPVDVAGVAFQARTDITNLSELVVALVERLEKLETRLDKLASCHSLLSVHAYGRLAALERTVDGTPADTEPGEGDPAGLAARVDSLDGRLTAMCIERTQERYPPTSVRGSGTVREELSFLREKVAHQHDLLQKLTARFSEPVGVVAPPLGEHVERVAERKAVVAWLRDLDRQGAVPQECAELAHDIEAGHHLAKP